MAHILPNLPYSFDALEPFFDTATMQLHYSKHHQTYVDKLNAALAEAKDLQAKPLEALLTHLDTIPQAIRSAVQNHGGGHYNHSLFWTSLTPPEASQPQGKLAEAISQSFDSFDSFKLQFTQVAASHFGSGWAWLVSDPKDRKLKIYSLPNQDSPLSLGDYPLLGLDLWEHAYYLKYQNLRPEYIKAWWHLINWPEIAKRFERLNHQ